jgi:alcohol dehydrogenase
MHFQIDKLLSHYSKAFASNSIFRSRTKPRYHVVFVRPNGEMLKDLKEHIDAGRIKPVVGEVFEMEQVQAAHNKMEAGHSTGKLVLKISN